MFQYYGHRAKLRVVDREDELETLNLRALDIAKEVADRTGRLLAGNISNTTIFNRHDPNTIDEARSIFKVNCFMKYYSSGVKHHNPNPEIPYARLLIL